VLNEIKNSFKKGDVILVDYGKREGSEQWGQRPSLVISNNKNNLYSPTIVVVPLTSSKFKKKLPTHVELNALNSDVKMDSVILCEQPRSIDKQYILQDKPLFTLSDELLYQVDRALMIQLGIMIEKSTLKANVMAFAI
jgi:mRNA interferase MazF